VPYVKRLAILALAIFAAAAAPAAAHAAVPCRDRIYNQWYATGKISTRFPVSCYHDALAHIPTDAQVYSNLGADIRSALQAALRRRVDPNGVPGFVGRGPQALLGLHQTKGASTTRNGAAQGLGAVAVGPTNGGSSGLPTPIVILGAIAIALAAAGAAGTGWRYARRRRT